MRYAVNIINFAACGEARNLAELAHQAELAGWDGFFVWDHIAFDFVVPMADPWIALTAIAMRTKRIRIGAMVTPLPRRRPWKFARETASLDRLSGGRLVVGVGLGITQAEFDHLGEESDLSTRADMLDEGLAVVTALWRGEPVHHAGRHYRVQGVTFLPTPAQRPRIPIWVAGTWPKRAPLRRAAAWDGVFPIPPGGDPEAVLTPEQVREIVEYTERHRTASSSPFDVSVAGTTPGDDPIAAADLTARYAQVGATWWHEVMHEMRSDLAGRAGRMSWLDAMSWRIRQGPPQANYHQTN